VNYICATDITRMTKKLNSRERDEIQIFTHAVENNKIALLKGNVSS